jgi:hypothetical protein
LPSTAAEDAQRKLLESRFVLATQLTTQEKSDLVAYLRQL